MSLRRTRLLPLLLVPSLLAGLVGCKPSPPGVADAPAPATAP